MPAPEICVNMLPPNLSAKGPPAKRMTEPMSGPRNAYFNGSGASAASIPGMFPYKVFIMSGNAAAKPEKEPNVMIYVQTMKYACLLSVMSPTILPMEGFFIGILLSNNQQRIPAMMRYGTYQKAAFCSHISFLTVTSVITPASFFLTSAFIPFVASVSVMTMSLTVPASSFTTVMTWASPSSLTTTSLTTPASFVIFTANTGVAFVKTCGAPAAPTTTKPIIQGVTNWVTLTPRFPIPACNPKAVPCSLLGKNMLVEGMKDEKSPPPKPQRNDIIRKCI